ncbi:Leucine-rich repeat receptor-like protein kinase pxl1 [Thalictrum thalictroides]|uniref:non-specific serine/threonine protein kinase n=1 Tax=Thalictrum thalictroides TaxID=46969 RepID=A0A7J6WZ37_THATH|nr:Leucine-rich repeat receptor-like protein kinase pxl1 [Thalictrum thalictroides]
MARGIETSFTIMIILFISSVNAASNGVNELKLLLSFKASLRGDPLHVLSNWNSSSNTHYCNWYGISCFNSLSYHVSRIELSGKNISGKLSPSLFLLPFVENINLSNNVFFGDLPIEMFTCLSLQHLNLSNNNFTGSIPYGSLPSLETLDLSNNMLTGGIPPEIGLFSRLQVLDIGGNLLIGEIPNSISNLQNLHFLTLAGNQLIGEIPSELGQLKNLNWIYIGYNNLSGQIPKELGYLPSLNHLDLVYNNLTGEIPSSLGNLINLQYLFLYQNRLTGSIPRSVFNLRNLISLDLSDNNLSGEIPELIIQLKNLEILHLFSNNFTGKIPRGIAFLPRLRVLQLWSNQLSGEIPRNLGIHNNLTALDLSSNNLTGRIPEGLCSSGQLFKLILFSNFLQGQIPASLLNYCTSLQRIRIQNNQLSGELSSQFIKLPLVYYLDISGNRMSGRIDHGKWNMPLLQMLNLAGNSFTGRLPEFISSSKLDSLDLSENNLSGNIPASFGNLSELMQLNLQVNQLSGSIPEELSSCKKLVNLDLSGNQLTGQIPVGFSEMPVLSQLDLSVNHLSGQIPLSLGQIESLVEVNVSHNNFHGSLPSTVAFLSINASSVAGNHLCGGDIISGLPPCKAGKKHVTWLFITSLVVALVFLVVSILLTLFIQRRKKVQLKKVESYDQHGVWDLRFFDSKASTACSIEDIVSAMQKENILSRGKNGTLYKGKSSTKEFPFIVKQLTEGCSISSSFWDEITERGKLRHPNVVKLIGIARSEKNGCIIYEFIDHAKSLSNVLSDMTWERRCKIIVGIAKALQFFHFRCSPSVLVENFSLEKVIVDGKDEPLLLLSLPGLVASDFKGFLTSAYIAPETRVTKETTKKSDIYAFGVVLIQILSGKGTVDAELGMHYNMVDWARFCYSECHLGTWIDAAMKVNSSHYHNEIVEIMNLALQCTATDPMARPCSSNVVKTLETVLRSRSCVWLPKISRNT